MEGGTRPLVAAAVSFPRTAQALSAALEAAGLAPDRRHGQCFLTDVQAVDAIVRDAEVTASDHVVEVGTGPGLLTHALAATGAAVTTFDIDARLQRFTRELVAWPPAVLFVEGDVLAGKHELAPAFAQALEREPAPGGRRLLVSNLPYNVATPILLGVLGLPRPPQQVTVMVQREVAEKLLAPPGQPAYGAPSVLVGLAATGRILRRFPPQVFWPRPRVDSALLRLDPREPSPYRAGEADAFGRFVTALFMRRRKVLRTAASHALGVSPTEAEASAVALGLDPTMRAQDVAPSDLLALWRTRSGVR